MSHQLIRNERGGMGVLLSVFVLSTVLVVSLTSVYTYIENRAKFQGRIKANMDMSYVMEDLARTVRSSFDDGREAFLSGVVIGADCDGAGPGTAVLGYIDCAMACVNNNTAYPVTGGQETALPSGALGLCVKATLSVNPNRPYHCTFNSDGNGAGVPSYCAGLSSIDNSSDDIMIAGAVDPVRGYSDIKNEYSKIDSLVVAAAYKIHPLLETKIPRPAVLGWILPQQAFAGGGGGVDCSDKANAELPECITEGGGPIGGGGIDCEDEANKENPYCNGEGGGGTIGSGGPNCADPQHQYTPYCVGVTTGACGSNPRPDSAACAAQNGGAFSTPAAIQVAINTPNCITNPSAKGCQPCSGQMRETGVDDPATNRTISCVKISVCPPSKPNNCTESEKISQMVKLM